jgi:hypothetical protein
LYISNGSGWYRITLVNESPSITLDSETVSLGASGNTVTVGYTVVEPEGTPVNVTATTTANTSQANVTINSSNNSVTIENLSAEGFSANVTLTATDGVNIGTDSLVLEVSYLSELWDETVLSIGTSSTNSLDNSTFIDRSTNAHTVTPTGSPTQTAFHPYLDNWSVEFDGSGDYLTAPTSLTDNDFTVEGWLHIETSSSTNRYIFLHAPSGSTTSSSFLVYYREDTFYVQWGSGDAYFATSYSGLKNQWFHFAVTYNKSAETVTGYLNGTQVGTFSASSRSISSDNTSIGHRDGGGTFDGYISNLRVTNGSVVYTTNFTPSTEKLTAVSGTSLLTCQSNRFIDNSASAHAITVGGNVKVSAFNPFGQESEYAVGENKGSSYWVDNSSNYLDLGSSFDFYDTTDWGIQCWVYPNSTQRMGILSDRNNSSSGGITVHLTDTVGGTLEPNAFFPASSTLESNVSLKPYEWSHIHLKRIGTTAYWYINGELVNSGSWTSTPSSGENMMIGRERTSTTDNFDGYISDLKIMQSNVSEEPTTLPISPVGSTNAYFYLSMDNAGIFDKTGLNTLTPVGDTATSTTQTKFADTAMYFDGTGDYLTIPDSSLFAFGSGDFTIEAWIYANSLGSYNGVIGQWPDNGSTANNSFVLETVGTNIDFYWVSGTTLYTLPDIGAIALNQWIHVAVARNGNSIYGFINGSLAKTGSITQTLNDSSSAITVGGNVAGGGGWNGYIEGVQILKGVAKYTSNFTVPNRTQGRIYQAES